MSDNVIIEARNVCKYFPVRGLIGNTKQSVKALDDVSLDLYEGETYGVVGETGCGKSTLGRSIMNLFPITSGTVKLDGVNEKEIDKKILREKIKMIFQDPYTSLHRQQGRAHGCRAGNAGKGGAPLGAFLSLSA